MPKRWLPCQYRAIRAGTPICLHISKDGGEMTVSVDDCWGCLFRAYTPSGQRAAEHYRSEKGKAISPPERAWLDSLGIQPRRRRG